jgi:hypothetical protein
MVRPLSHTADPSTDAAALFRRMGFALLFFAIPMGALFTRRAVVVLAPMAVVLLVLAAALDGHARNPRDRLTAVVLSPGGLAGAVLLLWTGLSLIWTPFLPQASERVLNIAGMALMALAGYLSLPERMRSANLYLLPVGVVAAAVTGAVLALRGGTSFDPEGQSLERGMIVLVLLLWPAVTWLHSRGRNLEALVVALAVAGGAFFTTDSPASYGLAAGAVIFALTTALPFFGSRLTALAMAGLLLLAPLLPFVLAPLARMAFRPRSPLLAGLDAWQAIILREPLRLVTGHGLETALRGRIIGAIPPSAPSTFLFEIWYELGLVGAAAGAVLLYRAARGAGGDRPILGPGIMAAFATAYALGCLGIGTAQVWWFTTLLIVVLVFAAIERGQYRTTRPKAILRRLS